MPIIKSAIKRMRQTLKKRARNVKTKRELRVSMKTFDAAPDSKSLSDAQSKIDTAVKKGLMPKNTAARKKAQLAKVAKAAGTKSTVTKAAVKKAPAKAAKPAAKPAVKKAAPKKAAAQKTE